MSDGRRKGTLGYTNLGCAGAVAAGSGKRKINVAGKRLLEGVIRSVGSHNKYVETTEMWRQHALDSRGLFGAGGTAVAEAAAAKEARS
eukprot:gene21772-35581_t